MSAKSELKLFQVKFEGKNKKLLPHIRTVGWDGEQLFVSPLLAGMSNEQAIMCCGFDGEGFVKFGDGGLLVRSEWLAQERPAKCEIYDEIVRIIREVEAGEGDQADPVKPTEVKMPYTCDKCGGTTLLSEDDKWGKVIRCVECTGVLMDNRHTLPPKGGFHSAELPKVLVMVLTMDSVKEPWKLVGELELDDLDIPLNQAAEAAVIAVTTPRGVKVIKDRRSLFEDVERHDGLVPVEEFDRVVAALNE